MMLDDETRKEVEKLLSKLEDEVNIFYVEGDSPFNSQIKELLNELVSINRKLLLKTYRKDDKESKVLGVRDSPAIVLLGKNIKGRIIYYGIPSGYEFATFLDTIIKASTNNPELSSKAKNFLDNLKHQLRISVFVTPTCPHCPVSASIAFRFAIYSEKVIGEVIESSEFPEWADKFSVMGVPKTVINDDKNKNYVGGYPEELAVDKLKQMIM
ncbi:MAG: protein disulfide oxidoreductase [Candidatus Woesearchaeota archaeon]